MWKAIERTTRKKVAIKKIFDAFANATDAQRTYREIFLNTEMGSHPNIVKIENLKNAQNENDLYIIFELMDTDLHTVIRADCATDIQIRYIAW